MMELEDALAGAYESDSENSAAPADAEAVAIGLAFHGFVDDSAGLQCKHELT